MRHTPSLRSFAPTALSVAALLFLGACGGGDSAGNSAPAPAPAAVPAVPVVPAPRTLSGTVAVGAPITSGKLRILDANGAVVASDVAIDGDGNYAAVTLTGPAPYRIEACGYAGPNYLCVYSVASAAGTANVTPLTTATVLLAAGQAPDALMSGTAPALTAVSVATAQDQLRTSLASVLTSAGVASNLDFVAGALAAGSRTGHDGVLDAVGVTLGQDANPFVQITPRLGTGNLYLEQGSSSGSVTATASAAGLQLAGLETLFRDMSESLAKPAACGGSTGLQRSLAGAARLSMGGHSAQGAAQVAEALCGFFALGEDGSTPLWGSRLLSPTLGRCDLGGPEPVCRVSFVLQSPTGDVQSVGSGLGVTKEAGVWKFVGDLLPIEVHASARAQRTVRIDTPTAVIDYDRAIAFEVSAVPGLACARFAQRDASGAPVTVAYYKRHPGATQQARLSLWTPVAGAGAGTGTGAGAASGTGASLDPMVGATRSEDDSWLALPQGVDGDAMVRNFYRGGRSVSVSLYGDAACSTPFAVGGESVFEVEVDGVPPVWSAMPNLPWPEIDADTHTALRALTLGAGADGSLRAAWTFNRGPLGLNDATVCASRADCGEGGSGRLGERSLRPGAREATLALHNRGSAVESTDARTISLNGRNGEGVGLSSNFSACPQVAAGQACR